MKKRHLEFLLKFHKRSRHLYALRNCRIDLSAELDSMSLLSRIVSNNIRQK
jgi:hypothetical protein